MRQQAEPGQLGRRGMDAWAILTSGLSGLGDRRRCRSRRRWSGATRSRQAAARRRPGAGSAGRAGAPADRRGDRMARAASEEIAMKKFSPVIAARLLCRCPPTQPSTSATQRQTSHASRARRQGLQVFPRRFAQEGPGGPLFLPGRVLGRLLGRGARVRRGDRPVRGARRDGDRRLRRRHRHARASSRCRRARASSRSPPTRRRPS